jgi:hypothetical protein
VPGGRLLVVEAQLLGHGHVGHVGADHLDPAGDRGHLHDLDRLGHPVVELFALGALGEVVRVDAAAGQRAGEQNRQRGTGGQDDVSTGHDRVPLTLRRPRRAIRFRRR